MDGGKLVGDLNEVAKKRLPDHEMAVVVTVFLIAKVVESSPAKMVSITMTRMVRTVMDDKQKINF